MPKAKRPAPPAEIEGYAHGGDIVADMRHIIDGAQARAYQAVNAALILRNWLLGRRLAEDILDGDEKAEYGAKIIVNASRELTKAYGKGFNRISLYLFLRFYRIFPGIVYTLSKQSPALLSWSHYRVLLQVLDPEAREWYEKEAASEGWSVRTLQRNVDSQYYHRLLASQVKEPVEAEMRRKTAPLQKDPLGYLKNPAMAEFLGFPIGAAYSESELESRIITHLQEFLMELGKGYAFVARQKRMHTEKEDYYIDLVFYNYLLKCFVLIDLKTSKIRHQDVGQMDMYVRMFDERVRGEGDNPTLGVILCAETDEDVMRYSVLNDKDQLFAAKYLTCMPTKDQLRAEIEKQKALLTIERREKAEDAGA